MSNNQPHLLILLFIVLLLPAVAVALPDDDHSLVFPTERCVLPDGPSAAPKVMPDIRWNGSVSSDWNNPFNWNLLRVPRPSDVVGFSGPVFNACRIQSVNNVPTQIIVKGVVVDNQTLTIDPGNTLTVAQGTDGVTISGAEGALVVEGMLNVRIMSGDGIRATANGILRVRQTGQLDVQIIDGNGITVSGGELIYASTLSTVMDITGNGLEVGQDGFVNIEAGSELVVSDCLDNAGAVKEGSFLALDGIFRGLNSGDNGLSLTESNMIIGEDGLLELIDNGVGGIADARFTNSGTIRILNTGSNDAIDTDELCFNNGTIIIDGAGDDGIDVQDNERFENGGTITIANVSASGVDDGNFLNAGLLTITGAGESSIGDGSFSNLAGGTLVTSGLLEGTLTFANQSRLEPGLGVGCLSFANSLGFDGVTVAIQLDGPQSCTAHDRLTFSGDLTLNGTILELGGGYVPQAGDQFTLFSGPSQAPVGSFAGLPEGTSFDFNGVPLVISYLGGDGNDVVLTAIDPLDARWTGAVNSNWCEAGNWNTGEVPGPESRVTIGDVVAPPAVIATGAVVVKDIRIINTGQFQLNSGASLTLSGGEHGFTLEGDSPVEINGSLTIREQTGDYGLYAVSDLNVGTTGSITLEGLGLELFTSTLSVSGAITSTAAPEDGVMLQISTLSIDTTGSVTLTTPTRMGINQLDGADTVSVAGQLNILNAGQDGIIGGSGDLLTIDTSGAVTITAASSHGLNNLKTSIDGTLSIGGSGNDAIRGNRSYTVNTGGTLAVDGFVRSVIDFTAGSRLSIGGPTGCATFQEEVLFNNAILAVRIDDPEACTDYNQLVWREFFRLNGASLELSGDYVPAAGETFEIVNPIFDGSPSSGTFNGLPNGATFDFNGALLEITYGTSNTPGGRNVLLTTIQGVNQATWTGAVSSDWYNPGNWASGAVPTADDDVLIEAGANPAVIAAGSVTVASLLLKEDGNLTVAEGATLNLGAGTAGLVTRSGQLNVNGEVMVVGQTNGAPLLAGSTIIGPSGKLAFAQTSSDIIVRESINCNGQLLLAGGAGLSLQGDGGLTVGATGDCQINGAEGTGLLHNGAGVVIHGKLTILNSGGDGIQAINDNGMAFSPTSEVTLRNNAGHGISCEDRNSYPISVRGVLTISDSGLNAVDEGIFLPRTGGTFRCAGTVDTRWQSEENYRLAVGDSVGCLSAVNGIDLENATLVFIIEGVTPCTDYSQFVNTGGINIEDAELELNGSYVPEVGDAFTLIRNPNSGTFSRRFVDLPEGALLDFNGALLQISYTGGTNNNDVVLTTVQNANEAFWTGATSSNWYEAGNWTNGRVPRATDRVIIGSIPDAPIAIIDTGVVAVAELRVVGTDGQFRLNEGADLTISGGADGLVLTGYSLIVIDGNLLITNQSSNYGLTAESDLIIGLSGTLTLDQLGVEMGGINKLIVNGTVNCLNAPADGVVIDDGTLDISPTGSWIIDTPVGTGLRITNDPSEIKVDGSLFVLGAGGDGIIGDGEMLTIGASGVLTVRDASGVGVRNINAGINGTLIISGSGDEAILLDSEDFTFSNGSTLQAEGTIRGEVGFDSESNLQPGSSPGCLAFEISVGNLPIVTFDLEGATVCADYDQIILGRFSQLNGATLRLAGTYTPAINDVFTIVRNDADSDIVGIFAGLPEGSLINFNNSLLEISYNNGRDVTLTAVAILPLDLLSFTGEARDKTNLLNWTTANEEDFSHFEVERSLPLNPQRGNSALTWEYLGEVAPLSSGEGPGERFYTFEDDAITAYYRLKLIDLDGTFSYSEVVYLENNSGGNAGAMKVYPNPSTGRFTVDLSEANLPADGGGELRLVDLHGHQIWNQQVSTDQPRLPIEIARPHAGVYLLTLLTDNGQKYTKRIVIQ